MTEEEPILFIECTRDETSLALLNEMRTAYENGTGLGGDLTGTLEVHFREENSAGSAVKREWFALTSEALVNPSANLFQVIVPRLFHDCSTAVPRLFHDCSTTVPRLFHDCSTTSTTFP